MKISIILLAIAIGITLGSILLLIHRQGQEIENLRGQIKIEQAEIWKIKLDLGMVDESISNIDQPTIITQ